MHYVIVNQKTLKQFYFGNKQELHDWINLYSFMLTKKYSCMLYLHRSEKSDYPPYRRVIGYKISTLYEYIVKHKLIEYEKARKTPHRVVPCGSRISKL